MSAPKEDTMVTIAFNCDIRKVERNPFFIETPFGKPAIIGVGDIFAERDALEERVRELEERL